MLSAASSRETGFMFILAFLKILCKYYMYSLAGIYSIKNMKIYKNSMNIRKTYFTAKAQQIDICHNLKICYVWLLLSVNPRHMQTI